MGGIQNTQVLWQAVFLTDSPEVAILGADQKERGLWGRECHSANRDKVRMTKSKAKNKTRVQLVGRNSRRQDLNEL